jgi:outer membrane protein TolC
MKSALATTLMAATLMSATLALATPAQAQTSGPAKPDSVPREQGSFAVDRVTMAEAVSRALARNPTFATANEEIRRTEALVEEARSGWFPTLTGNGTYTRLDGDRTFGTPPHVIAAQDSVAATLTLAVPLVVPKPWAVWSHAKDNVEATVATRDDIRRQVAVATARAYLTVVAQKYVLVVNERARDNAKAHYDYSHQRLVGGVGNRIDDVRAAQELATDESLVQASYSGLAKAEEALAVLVGTDRPIDTAEEPTLSEPPSLGVAMDDATKRRSDVIAADVRAAAAGHVVRDDWTDYAPYLVGIAQPFYQNPPSLVTPLTGWQAQLVLTVPLYDGGLRYGQAKERDALSNEAKIALDATVRQARSDVRTAFEEVRRADQALTAARSAASLAREALDLASLAYRSGATTNIEVIDAERRARDTETQVEVAADNARQARLDMLAATGRFP